MQANYARWPHLEGKYVDYYHLKKERWTYHAHIQDEVVFRTLKEKFMALRVKTMVGDIGDLDEVWYTLDTCFNRPRST